MPPPHHVVCAGHTGKRCHSDIGIGKASAKGQEEEQIFPLIGCSSPGVVLAESFAGISLSDRPMAPPGLFEIWAIVFLGRMDNVTLGQLTAFTKDSTA